MRREFFIKYLSVSPALEIAFLRSLSKIHDPDHKWGSEQRCVFNRKLFIVWKLPYSDYRTLKLMLYCICFTNLCVNVFVLLSSTRDYHPKVPEHLDLLQCIAAHLQILHLPTVTHSSNCLWESILFIQRKQQLQVVRNLLTCLWMAIQLT